jgi:energy-coupling factor transporter ATP-binding protein EcfA2
MPTTYYTAQKSRAEGRPSFAVTFRHPLRTDAKGKPGLKVRRGLGTADPAEADRLVAELNALLSDEHFWSLSARVDAAREFSPLVVNAFYDAIEVPVEAGDQLRDGLLPLPGPDSGYSRVLLVGTTGAGKTTLLRQLIGAHPRRDRFPSTSTGKTTVSDLELVTAPGEYTGVVTFLPERAVRGYVQENVTAACLSAMKAGDDATVARHLLQHPDQKFRLQYVLGDWPAEDSEDEGDWGFDGEEDAEAAEDASEAPEDVPTVAERAANSLRLASWVDRIRSLVNEQRVEVAGALELDWGALDPEEREAAEAVLAEVLESADEHGEIVLEIVDAIAQRFERLEGRGLTKSTSGWPTKWTMSSASRTEFLRALRWFSSNYASRYGRLLTPLVQGIRVRGPFYAPIAGVQTKLVLIDGQGLGHTPESAASVTTNITRRFRDVDVILLVDNAEQPMQAAPLAVVRSVATGGFEDKLAIAFTHFDQVKGPNMPTVAAKREHVVGAARNVLNSLRAEIGQSLVTTLEQGLDSRCFMLGWMNKAPEMLTAKMHEQLRALLAFFDGAIAPAKPIPATPVYDPASLMFAVQAATREFQGLWGARLGLESQDGVSKEPWASVKALNRRIADGWGHEYRHLMPVADLFSRLSEEISRYLDQPLRWEGDSSDAAERERAVASVRRAVSGVAHDFAQQRVIERHLADWVRAYQYKGRGSTLDRARNIRGIYEDAAPVPGAIFTAHSRAFLDDIRKLVHEAIEEGGGSIASA